MDGMALSDVDVTDPVAELRVWMYDYDMLSADGAFESGSGGVSE